MIDSYFICATPRTGSSLLLGLLRSTGIAGHPEAYFRDPDEQLWADRWRIPGPADPAFDYPSFVRAARAAGTTENGVFGAKLMWGTLDQVVHKLAPAVTGADLDVLTGAFGSTRFVYLHRDDVLAQAVSWLRAEQTQIWYAGAEDGGSREPAYDESGIDDLLRTIGEHNRAWREWFRAYGIEPHEVTYEGLTADLAGTTRGILGFLGLDLPPGRAMTPRHERQADALNDDWIARYRATR